MKKTIIIFGLLALNHAFSSITYGQKSDTSKFKIGFGISLLNINDFETYSSEEGYVPYSTSISIPMTFRNHFRMEPELGFSRVIGKNNNFNNYISMGLGLYFLHSKRELTLLYGVKLGADINNIYEALAIGGEYFFSPRFSLGGMFMLKLTQTEKILPNNTALSTNSSILLRFYFK
ncbi:MAG: hypothetical protein ABR968_01095 [Bacteroidales bacterium]|jgi:hypothetical protein